MSIFHYMGYRISCLTHKSDVFAILGLLGLFSLPVVAAAIDSPKHPEVYSVEQSVEHAAGHSIERSSVTVDREIRITNGSRTSVGQYPFLAAVMSGRQAVINFGVGPAAVRFLSGGIVNGYSGELVDCGFATSACLEVVDKVCSIIFDFPLDDIVPLTPSMQLQNCRRGGGIGAVFRPNSRDYIDRLDLFDGNPSIPAVYVYEDEGYQNLLLALSEGGDVSVASDVSADAICGGSYLGGVWVLTAAHCVVRKLKDGSFRIVGASELLVNVGAYNLDDEKVFVQAVEEILINDYRIVGGWDENDYALLRLDSEPQRGEAINLISSDNLDASEASAAPAMVVGWGSTQVREPLTTPTLSDLVTPVPLVATLSLHPVASCRALWRDFLLLSGAQFELPDLRDIHLCASSDLQQDTCQGDSGGPLLVDVDGELQLAGVTSFGLGCGGTAGLPGVYSKASEFIDWVQRQTGLTRGQEGVRVSSVDFALPSSIDGNGGGGGAFGVDAMIAFVFALLLKTVAFLRLCYFRRRMLTMLIAFFVISGCGADQPIAKAATSRFQPAGQTEQLDAVYAEGVVSARVVSTGCTRDQDFSIKVAEGENGECRLSVYRNQPDLCKRAAEIKSIAIPWSMPSLCQSVSFSNPTLTSD